MKDARRNSRKNHESDFIRWVQYDEDVLEMARMLVEYFRRDSDEGRSPTYQSALKRANRLLGVNCRPTHPDNGRRIFSYLGKRWRERLETAGIDPDTMLVVNRDRWAITWDKMKRHNNFWPQEIENDYRCGWLIPEDDQLTPYNIVVTPSEKLVDPKKEEVDRSVYLSRNLFNNISL